MVTPRPCDVSSATQRAPAEEVLAEMEKKAKKKRNTVKQLQRKYAQKPAAAEVPIQEEVEKTQKGSKVKQLQSVFEGAHVAAKANASAKQSVSEGALADAKADASTNTDDSACDSGPEEIVFGRVPTASKADVSPRDRDKLLAKMAARREKIEGDRSPVAEAAQQVQQKWPMQPSVATWMHPLPPADQHERVTESKPKLAVPVKVKPACCRYARRFGA